jgi:hypothetical protein
MWERDPTLPLVIEEAWTSMPSCSSLSTLQDKLKNTQEHLNDWSQQHFGNATKEIKIRKAKIEKLWKLPRTNERDDEVRTASVELDELLHR